MTKTLIKLSENCTVEPFYIPKGKKRASRFCIGYIDANNKKVECNNPIYHWNKSGRCKKCNGIHTLTEYRRRKKSQNTDR